MTIKTQQGIMILGTHPTCGKTAVAAGLGASMIEAGFRVQAYKPLIFRDEPLLGPAPDQRFLNLVTQQYIQADTLCLQSAWDLSMPLWNRMIEQCKSLQYPCLLEGPGIASTPWQLLNHRLIDGVDVAQQLGLSIILVAPAGEDFLASTRSALAFIRSKQMDAIGIIRVQTQASQDLAPADAMLLSQLDNITFLGDLPYSPSIVVSNQQQGNLIRLTQENIDLLPLQLGIGLKL